MDANTDIPCHPAKAGWPPSCPAVVTNNGIDVPTPIQALLNKLPSPNVLRVYICCMKRGLILSIIVNIICLPLAAIYVIRKIEFYSLVPKPTTIQNVNVFWNIRNSEFQSFEVDSNSVVFMGDSFTQNFEVAEAFNNIHVKNRGIILDGTASVLGRLDYVADKHPKKIFIQIGINDLLSGVQPQIVANDVSKMIEQVNKVSPQTLIYIQSVFPTNWNKYKDQKPVLLDIIDLNKKLRELSRKGNCVYIELFSLLLKGKGLNSKYDCGDNLHLNGQGYVLWRDCIKRFID